MNHRGYEIWPNTKTINHRNKISGHEWSTQAPARGFYISGPGISVDDIFYSTKKAIEHIDFILKFNLNDMRQYDLGGRWR